MQATPRGYKKFEGTDRVLRQDFVDIVTAVDIDNEAQDTALTTHKTAAELDHPDNSVTDVKIGTRTITDTTAAVAAVGTLTAKLSQLGYMIKAITGKAAWYTAPAATLETIFTWFHATTGHKHTGGVSDGPQIPTTGIADNAVTAAKLGAGACDDTAIGTRTITDTTAAVAAVGTLTAKLSQLGYMIKAITGKAAWYTAPATTLEALNTLIVAAAAANKLLKLDGDGKLPADITGSAATATKLATARTIAGVSFNGSANIDIPYSSLTGHPTIPAETGTRIWVSGENFIATAGVPLILNHGIPSLDLNKAQVDVIAKCIVAGGGYEVGDILHSPVTGYNAAFSTPFNPVLSATTVTLINATSSVLTLRNKVNGTLYQPSLATNWKVIVRIIY